jgi:hypothetical protein
MVSSELGAKIEQFNRGPCVCVCGGGGLKDFFDQEVIRIRTPVFELTILSLFVWLVADGLC